jgi:hypothetical protein
MQFSESSPEAMPVSVNASDAKGEEYLREPED